MSDRRDSIAYPERAEPGDGWVEQLKRRTDVLWRRARLTRGRLRDLVDVVSSHGRSLERCSDDDLRRHGNELRRELRARGLDDETAPRALALAREVATRTTGQRAYDVQIVGAWGLLQGMISEMETGEGKTLTASLAAAAAALGGTRVHVVTVNDYLADRDAESMGPIYEALDLRVGVVVGGMEPAAKQEAYGCDITYCTNKDVAFDYMRDRLTLGRCRSSLDLEVERLRGAPDRRERLLLRGLEFAIVDEADSVLIDEARTPLIDPRPENTEEERKAYVTAMKLANRLEPGRDYRLERQERQVLLTPRGQVRLEELIRTVRLGGVWRRRRMRHELITQTLAARCLFIRDRHYMVRDGEVQIIDEYTGRVLPDRSWEHGLHQAVEVKEGCPPTPRNRPVARFSYQRFFRRYLRLSGLTGTAREVRGELAAVYGLGVLSVPTHRAPQRRHEGMRVLSTASEKWECILERTREIHDTGRPVLVGTRSVESSEKLSLLLAQADLPHRVLNARQDRKEAQTIELAGEPGSITVATNMAGRGTDIRVRPEVAAAGGLHVIATELHEARRIDRQLVGRTARQGEPGSCEAIVSLDDELIETHARGFRAWLTALRQRRRGTRGSWRSRLLIRKAQSTAERRHARMRRDLLRMERQLEETLSFTGPSD